MPSIKASFKLARQKFLLDAAFDIPAHGVTALFGSSGSGKTTLLRCIAGLEKPDRGYFAIGDHLWQDDRFSLPVHRRALGYVFQESNLFAHLTVEKNLRYGLKHIAPADRKIHYAEALTLLGISELITRFPAELSGGQRQRVAMARALLTSPDLLLMDEPLASLDIKSRSEILPYLERLHLELKIPIIYVSHSPDEVVRIADHMILMDNGKVLEQGPINELLTRTDLPLAQLDEACAVVEGEITRHDEQYHLTYLDVKGGQVAVSHKALPVGHKVRVRILARDVSLALQPGQKSSITNVFPVRIERITEAADPAKVLIRLDMGGEHLLSQITRRSVDVLNLEVGQVIYAQVKSVALMR